MHFHQVHPCTLQSNSSISPSHSDLCVSPTLTGSIQCCQRLWGLLVESRACAKWGLAGESGLMGHGSERYICNGLARPSLYSCFLMPCTSPCTHASVAMVWNLGNHEPKQIFPLWKLPLRYLSQQQQQEKKKEVGKGTLNDFTVKEWYFRVRNVQSVSNII